MPKHRPFGHGHAPGHIRECFGEALEAYHEWWLRGGELPTVTGEIRYVPHQISIAEACGLLWNCTDIMPGGGMDLVAEMELPVRRCTYAAVARAVLDQLKEAQERETGR
jgi:hypothetical protein